MRRAASYSDSFLVLPPIPSINGGDGLTPILSPLVADPTPIELTPPAATVVEPVVVVPNPWPRRVTLFLFKGGLHVLCISAFETFFYFLYVNRSENQGILTTIDTYYRPLVANCSAWSNTTRWLLDEILTYEIHPAAVDAAGAAAAASRAAYNHTLLVWSSMYSVICFAVCAATAGVIRWKGWAVSWRGVFGESALFVLLLGLYELFFFRTIIYNYNTLSTAELNRYILDGLEQCLA